MENQSPILDIAFARNVDNHRQVIDALLTSALSGKNHTKKDELENPFNYHLADMNGFVIQDKGTHKKYTNTKTFTKSDYKYIESFIFHNSRLQEKSDPIDFDGNQLLNVTDYFYEKIKSLFSKDEMKSEEYKYFIDTTYSTIDSFYQYELMHPNSNYNPWSDVFMLCSNGYFLLCEDKDDLKGFIGNNYYKKIVGEKSVTGNNMGVLAKGAIKSNRLSGFIMDDRFSFQNVLFDLLQNNAKGHGSPLNSKQVLKVLTNKSRKQYHLKTIQLLLNSMKRTGIIGSSSQGYYSFHTIVDVEKSIDFHDAIRKGLSKTIEALESRRSKFI